MTQVTAYIYPHFDNAAQRDKDKPHLVVYAMSGFGERPVTLMAPHPPSTPESWQQKEMQIHGKRLTQVVCAFDTVVNSRVVPQYNDAFTFLEYYGTQAGGAIAYEAHFLEPGWNEEAAVKAGRNPMTFSSEGSADTLKKIQDRRRKIAKFSDDIAVYLARKITPPSPFKT